jgi:hypothetical protein
VSLASFCLGGNEAVCDFDARRQGRAAPDEAMLPCPLGPDRIKYLLFASDLFNEFRGSNNSAAPFHADFTATGRCERAQPRGENACTAYGPMKFAVAGSLRDY